MNVRAHNQGYLSRPRRSAHHHLLQSTLKIIDHFAKELHSALVARNLTNIVDVVFVSDHGMADTTHPEVVYVEDILGDQGFADIEHMDGDSPLSTLANTDD